MRLITLARGNAEKSSLTYDLLNDVRKLIQTGPPYPSFFDKQLGRRVYEISYGISGPILLKKVSPKPADICGTVVLTMVIDERGMARVRKVRQSLRPDLDLTAIRTIPQWRFKPAERKGQNVPVKVDVEVTFPPSPTERLP